MYASVGVHAGVCLELWKYYNALMSNAYVCHSVDTTLQQHVHLGPGIAHMHTQMCIHGVRLLLHWCGICTTHFSTSHKW